MRRLFVITLGFDEKFAIRCLVRNNIQNDDFVLLLTTSIDEKVRKAVNSLFNFLRKIGNKNFKLEIIEGNFFEAIEKIKDVLKEYKDYQIIINISGGMRWLIISVLFSILNINNIEKIEIEKEDFSEVIEIPGEFIKLLKEIIKIDSLKMKVLKEITNGADNVEKLSKILGRDVTTTRRYIQELEDFLIIKKRKPLIFELKEFLKPFIE